MKYNAIIFTDSDTGFKVRSLGAYTIANTLRSHGYTALVIDYYMKTDIKSIFEFIKKFVGDETFFVGYSSTLFWKVGAPRLAFLGREPEELEAINRFVKTINPKTQIIFGGAYTKSLCTVNFYRRKNFGIDYVMHGYSETMITDFIKNCESGQPQRISRKFNDLKEIDYDSKGDSFKYSDTRHHWHETDFIEDGEALPLEVSRGCIFRCKFCSYPLLGKRKDDDTYIKHEETLLSEFLENYEKYKTLDYIIVDDTFNERIDKMEMMARIRDRSKLNLRFTGYNRLDLVHRKPEQLQLFKDINFVGHLFGIESLNYESAKSIGKGMRPEDVQETLHKIKDLFGNNCTLTGSFIVGLPHETPETFQKWFDMILDPSYPIDKILLNPLSLSENTHSKSEFLSNPARYGYDATTAPFWKNDVWDFDRCNAIVDECNAKLFSSGRNKIGSMLSLASVSLGLDFHEISNVSERDFDRERIKQLRNAQRDRYIDKLRKL